MIQINEEFCKGCRICTEFCPTKVLADSTSINKKGYTLPRVEHERKCNGCRLCELLCPEFAICITHE